jgi:DNA-binding transcriptional LysR family regulator
VNGRACGNEFFFVREAIASGLGIGPLPWFLARHEVAAGRITRVLPE